MKKLIASVLLLISIGLSPLSAQGITFKKDLSFEDALALAEKEGKPIFMDCYTTWCGPCKWMSANIFTRQDVGNYYNENFICLKVDMEKGEGIELAKRYKVKGYPTLLWLNAKGELLNVKLGASQEPKDYLKMGEEALGEKTNMVYLAQKKAQMKDEVDFMALYLDKFSTAGLLEDVELEAYYERQPLEVWLDEAHFGVIWSNVREAESPLFQKLVSNYEEVLDARGADAERFFSGVLYSSLLTEYFRLKKEEKLDEWPMAQEEILVAIPENLKDRAIFETKLYLNARNKEWDQYCEVCFTGVRKYYWNDANLLNTVAWNVFENSTNEKNLEEALVWAERAVELAPEDHAILDTYANLLLVNGLAKEALEIEEKALELAQKEEADTEAYEKVIVKIKEALQP